MLVSGLVLTLITLQLSTLSPVVKELHQVSHHHLRKTDTFQGALPPPLVISSLADSPEMLYEPLYQNTPTYFHPSEIPSSQPPSSDHTLWHTSSSSCPFSLVKLINPTSKQSKSCSWPCRCLTKTLFFPTGLTHCVIPVPFSQATLKVLNGFIILLHVTTDRASYFYHQPLMFYGHTRNLSPAHPPLWF